MRKPLGAAALVVVVLAVACSPARARKSSLKTGTDPATGSETAETREDPGRARTDQGSVPGSLTDPTQPIPGEAVLVEERTITVEGVSRGYVLSRPKVPAGSLPIVLVLHGDGSNGAGMRELFPMDIVTGESAIVAYPSGQGSVWATYVAPETNADMKLIKALVAELGATYQADAQRVFGVGFSSGAYFLNQMACYENAFFRGVVANAGGAPSFFAGSPEADTWPETGYARCRGQQPAPTGGLAVMAIHGENDAPGGSFIATYWASLNGCAETREATAEALCQRHAGCPANRPTIFCSIPGLGHALWAEAPRQAWAFFQGL